MEGSRKRVLDALEMKVPDMVPFMFHNIDDKIKEEILGTKLNYNVKAATTGTGAVYKPGEKCEMWPYESTDARVAKILGLDAIGVKYFPPIFAETKTSSDGMTFITDGLLTSWEALDAIQLPDVDDERIYELLEDQIKKYEGEFAIFAKIRLGVSYILMSMGIEEFSYKIVDDPEFVKEAIRRYTKWVARLCKNLIETGIDFIWTADDMAYRTSPMFSNDVWDEFFFPYLKTAAETITIPWIFHSDGNLLPVMNRLLPLGMNGIHPLEPGSMDLSILKTQYGEKVCLIGNIDIDETLTTGTLEDVEREVRERINLLGPGGGYIISDSNSIPGYCKVENVLAMAKAVKKYREIY